MATIHEVKNVKSSQPCAITAYDGFTDSLLCMKQLASRCGF